MAREIIFMDGEFQGLSAHGTTLLSIALIKQTGEELYVEIETDVEVNDWVKENVLPYLTKTKVSREEAIKQIVEFVGKNKPILCAYVNQFDWMGINDLLGVPSINAGTENPFYWKPMDFASILFAKGYSFEQEIMSLARSIGINTDKYHKHHALDDTRLLKEIYEKVMNNE
jgi:DNA polymerase III epsilon subunit-like protein